MKFGTKLIHAGQEPDELTGAVVVPIYQTSTYRQEGINQHKGFEYSRTGNPTRQALEKSLAALESGRFGLAFSSGLAAEHAVISTLKPGDHVVASEDMYGGTYRLFEKVFRPYGLKFTYIKGSPSDFGESILPETRMFWIETPTNPLLRTVDIKEVAAIARSRDIKVVVDNTFASPVFQQPLLLGADLVVHSTTKYIGGHSDLIGGAVVLNDEAWYAQIKFLQNAIGAIPGPFDSWLTLRGIKTLALRMKKHEENALRIAEFLQNHPRVEKVFYPGLVTDDSYPVALKQMSGFGGIVSFRLKNGTKESINDFVRKLKLFSLAESLGGVESLICFPAAMTHGSIPIEQRIAIGVTDNLLRISVGIEDADDLTDDLKNALI